MATTKTKLEDLNAHLFSQLERLSNAKLKAEDIDMEATRAPYRRWKPRGIPSRSLWASDSFWRWASDMGR